MYDVKAMHTILVKDHELYSRGESTNTFVISFVSCTESDY